MVIAVDDDKAPYPLLDRDVAVAELLLALLPQQINPYAEIRSARITSGLLDQDTAITN